MAPAGLFETASDRIRLRLSGDLQSVDSVRNTPIMANGRSYRLGDIAHVRRGFIDPAAPSMRVQGKGSRRHRRGHEQGR